jgi:hypothetical protein
MVTKASSQGDLGNKDNHITKVNITMVTKAPMVAKATMVNTMETGVTEGTMVAKATKVTTET